MEKKIEEIANQYFTAWNKQDLSELRNLFDKNIVLKDWDIHEFGIENVLKANSNIFKNFPSIEIEILSMAISSKKVMCEIKVLINEKETIDVVDILEIENNLIQSIKAFKC